MPAGHGGPRRRPAASWRPGWSTCTPICASRAARRPRRSRPAARAAALGGYTAVVAMPNTEPAIDTRGRGPRGPRTSGAGACCDVRVAGRHHRRAAGPPAGPDGRDGGPRGAPLHRRRHRRAGRPAHAAGPGVRLRPRGHPGPALRGRLARRRRPHARGRVVEPARDPRASRPRPRS